MILTRTLSSEEMGVYALLVFVFNLIPILGTFALTSAAVKYLAQYLAEGRLEKAKSVIASLLQICLFSSLIALFIFLFSAELISNFLFGSPENALVIRLLAFGAAFSILNSAAVSCLQGLQRIREIASMAFINTLLRSVLGMALLIAGFGLFAVFLGLLVGVVVSSIVGLTLTMKYLGLTKKSHPLRPLIIFSYPLYVAGIIAFVATWVDSILLFSYMSAIHGPVKGQELLGIYYVAVRASQIPLLFSTAIITALFPQLSELYTQKGLDGLKEAFRVSTRYLALVGLPMIIGLATLSSPILVLFAGQEYAGAALPLTLMCLAALPAILGVSMNPILLTLERTKTASVITVISIFLSIAASFTALAYFNIGLPGPALARTLLAIVAFGLGVFALRRIFPLNFDNEALSKAALSSLLMVIVIFLLDVARHMIMSSSQLFDITLYLLVLYVFVGAATYLLSLFALKTIKKHDIELLDDYLPKGFKWIAAWLSRLAHLE